VLGGVWLVGEAATRAMIRQATHRAASGCSIALYQYVVPPARNGQASMLLLFVRSVRLRIASGWRRGRAFKAGLAFRREATTFGLMWRPS